jgi:hypothetical protein
MSRILDAMSKMNRIGAVPLLWVNAAIAFFVASTHAAFLALVRAGKGPPGMSDDVWFTYITIPIALVVLVAAILALARSRMRASILKLQSISLLLGAVGLAYFGVRVAIVGVPSGVTFVWNPVLFALALAYPVYLVQRSFSSEGAASNKLALQAPLWALGASVLISAAVMWRVASVAA